MAMAQRHINLVERDLLRDQSLIYPYQLHAPLNISLLFVFVAFHFGRQQARKALNKSFKVKSVVAAVI